MAASKTLIVSGPSWARSSDPLIMRHAHIVCKGGLNH